MKDNDDGKYNMNECLESEITEMDDDTIKKQSTMDDKEYNNRRKNKNQGFA